ncbi:MAG: sigma-70 family RNA polymerase sigma factor [Phycisphaerales bacterium]|nr:sigma-70 family RNA polymerase sigma factor [Phycisphaerales bacterium]
MTSQTTDATEREQVQCTWPQQAQDVLARLSECDQDVLERVLTTPEPFIDDEALHAKDADVTLFGVAAKLPSSQATRFPAPKPLLKASVLAGTRVPTLKADQERTLFLRLNYTRSRIFKILEEVGDRRLNLREARTLVAWGHWELDTRARIVELNMPLVLAMAKRTRLAGIDYNEMISEGNMALLRSVNKFDCARGFKFSTYACRAILKSFSRVAMRTSRYRGTFPVEYDPSIERSDHLERKRVDVEADCVDDLKMILSNNAAELTAVEETVIRERFALDTAKADVPVPKTLEQVGQLIGVTKERVRQIQNKALKKIRSALEDSLAA